MRRDNEQVAWTAHKRMSLFQKRENCTQEKKPAIVQELNINIDHVGFLIYTRDVVNRKGPRVVNVQTKYFRTQTTWLNRLNLLVLHHICRSQHPRGPSSFLQTSLCSLPHVCNILFIGGGAKSQAEEVRDMLTKHKATQFKRKQTAKWKCIWIYNKWENASIKDNI